MIRHRLGEQHMAFNLVFVTPVVSLVAGVLILIVPRLLSYIVALYLIFIGATGLWPHLLR
jgi:hypothetical protein